MIQHIKNWNRWRKGNINSKKHKLLVLLKLRHSPTMAYFMSKKKWLKGFEEED